MAKELLLMNDVDGLGSEGEIVKVAEGYARNYLLPRSHAVLVTPATRRLVEKKKAERLAREAATRKEAEELAAQLTGLKLTLKAKAGSEGKMYGSINATDVLAALEAQGITLSRKQLELESPIRDLGSHEISVKVHPEVTATVNLAVEAE